MPINITTQAQPVPPSSAITMAAGCRHCHACSPASVPLSGWPCLSECLLVLLSCSISSHLTPAVGLVAAINILGCPQVDADARLTAEEALGHPWVQGQTFKSEQQRGNKQLQSTMDKMKTMAVKRESMRQQSFKAAEIMGAAAVAAAGAQPARPAAGAGTAAAAAGASSAAGAGAKGGTAVGAGAVPGTVAEGDREGEDDAGEADQRQQRLHMQQQVLLQQQQLLLLQQQQQLLLQQQLAAQGVDPAVSMQLAAARLAALQQSLGVLPGLPVGMSPAGLAGLAPGLVLPRGSMQSPAPGMALQGVGMGMPAAAGAVPPAAAAAAASPAAQGAAAAAAGNTAASPRQQAPTQSQ